MKISKLLSVLLCAAMLLSLLAVGAFASGEASTGDDGLLDVDAETGATLTVGAAAQLINRLMKDSGVEGYDASIIGTADEASASVAALAAVGLLDADADPEDTMDGVTFDALLAAALRCDSLEGIGDYFPTADTAMVEDAYNTILSVVLIARNGTDIVCDTDKFLCVDDTSTWTAESTSGELHLAGIIGDSTISRMNGYGEYCYDVETKTYNGLTVYYNPYAGTDNRMPSDTSSFEMGYLNGGARLYPDYPVGLEEAYADIAYAYNEDVTDYTGEVASDEACSRILYATDGEYTMSDSDVVAYTCGPDASAEIASVNIRTLAPTDAINAVGTGTVINIVDSSVESTSGRCASAIAGAEIDVENCTMTNINGNGTHGLCVLYGSVLDVRDSEIRSNTSALSSDFGGGLILADNVTAHATSNGGGVLADGMTFAYVTNSQLITDNDAAASTAGCGYLNIDNCVLTATNEAHGIIYSYVFGMLASDFRSEITVANSTLEGTSDALVHIQANSVDVTLSNDDVSGADVDYLVYAENATSPASFYTRANIYLDNIDLGEKDVYFMDDTSVPCVKGYTDCYLNIYVGENVTWTGTVEEGTVTVYVLTDGEYAATEYTAGDEISVDTTGAASAEAAADTSATSELADSITLEGVNVMDMFTIDVDLTFADQGNGVKTFVISFESNTIPGTINMGTWTPDSGDSNEADICAAVQTAYEAQTGAGSGQG